MVRTNVQQRDFISINSGRVTIVEKVSIQTNRGVAKDCIESQKLNNGIVAWP